MIHTLVDGQSKLHRCLEFGLVLLFLCFPLVLAGNEHILWPIHDQADISCCTDQSTYGSAWKVECTGISTDSMVQCMRNYLDTVSAAKKMPLDVFVTNCNGNLLDDNFFVPYNLTGLQMQNCELTEIPYRLFNSFCSQLANGLRFINNPISVVPAGGFNNCTSLQELDLSSNSIANVSINAFQSLDSLVTLYLHYNKLESIEGFGDMKSLQVLVLTSNALSHIDMNAFAGLPNLVNLEMDTNNLTTLPEGVFDLLPMVKVLLLGDNPFYCDCSLQWLQDWLIAHEVGDDATCFEPVTGNLKQTPFCSPNSTMPSPTDMTSVITTTVQPTATMCTGTSPPQTTAVPTTSHVTQSSPITAGTSDTTPSSSTTTADAGTSTSGPKTSATPSTPAKTSANTARYSRTTQGPSTAAETSQMTERGPTTDATTWTSPETSDTTQRSSTDAGSSSKTEETSTTVTTMISTTTRNPEPVTDVNVTSNLEVSWSSQTSKVMVLYSQVSNSCSPALINDTFAQLVDGVHLVVVENKTVYQIQDDGDEDSLEDMYLVCVTEANLEEYLLELLCAENCLTTNKTATPDPSPVPTVPDDTFRMAILIGIIVAGLLVVSLIVIVLVCYLWSSKKKKKKRLVHEMTNGHSKPRPPPRPTIETVSSSYVDATDHNLGTLSPMELWNDVVIRPPPLHYAYRNPSSYLYLEPNTFADEPRHTRHTSETSGSYYSIRTNFAIAHQVAVNAQRRPEHYYSRGDNSTAQPQASQVQMPPSSEMVAQSSMGPSVQVHRPLTPYNLPWSSTVGHKEFLY